MESLSLFASSPPANTSLMFKNLDSLILKSMSSDENEAYNNKIKLQAVIEQKSQIVSYSNFKLFLSGDPFEEEPQLTKKRIWR